MWSKAKPLQEWPDKLQEAQRSICAMQQLATRLLANLQEATFVAVGGHTLWSQEIKLHHLHSAVLQLTLEGCARPQLGHDCCGGD